jgi:hypothetical protein
VINIANNLVFKLYICAVKKFLSILFSVLFLVISVQKTLVFGFYELEKEYVIEKLCVNKNVENSCCFGKCFVEKQTSEKEAEGIIINTLKNIKELLYFEKEFSIEQVTFACTPIYFIENSPKLSEYHETSFHPPNNLS